ncbi:MAG: alpha-E domain-containing protein [Parvularculaceae bacterium]|nr:alpha-E domain-containing protein [Parvularculaceae bacterium]
MLGKTAGGLFWMYRYLERAEAISRLIEAGFRIALTRSAAAEGEWASVVTTAGVRAAYEAAHRDFAARPVIDFLLRDAANPSSVLSCFETARSNARLVRTALTREVWEATNDSWHALRDALAAPVDENRAPEVLGLVRRHAAQVRGALHGTMLRNDIYNFCLLGMLIERADNTARILDVKYYVLLPSITLVGSAADNVQWETILRAVSAQRAYSWLNGEATAMGIAEFLILDRRMPRSLAFCYEGLVENLGRLAALYGVRAPAAALAESTHARLFGSSIQMVFDHGLHEFLGDFLRANSALGAAIERDFRFTE